MSTTLTTLVGMWLAVSSLLTPSVIPPATYQINATEETKQAEKVPETLLRAGFCETRLTHFNSDGTVIRGKENSKDVGIFQINESYHLSTATKLSLTLSDLSDNTKYALLLYKQYGATPWKWSYDPIKDQCKNAVKLPPRDSKEWKDIVNKFYKEK